MLEWYGNYQKYSPSPCLAASAYRVLPLTLLSRILLHICMGHICTSPCLHLPRANAPEQKGGNETVLLLHKHLLYPLALESVLPSISSILYSRFRKSDTSCDTRLKLHLVLGYRSWGSGVLETFLGLRTLLLCYLFKCLLLHFFSNWSWLCLVKTVNVPAEKLSQSWLDPNWNQPEKYKGSIILF